MKSHPNLYKTLKWTGAAATLLLVTVSVASAWWRADWTGTNWGSGVSGGAAYLSGHRPYPADWLGLSATRRPRSSGWVLAPSSNLARDNVDPTPHRNYIIPLWIPAALLLAATSRVWYLDTLARRRATLNLCPTCHYDRTGLATNAKCPECGADSASG